MVAEAVTERSAAALESLRTYLRNTGATKARWDSIITVETEIRRLEKEAEKGKKDSRRAEELDKGGAEQLAAIRAELEAEFTETREQAVAAARQEGDQALKEIARVRDKDRRALDRKVATAVKRLESVQKRLAEAEEKLRDLNQAGGDQVRTIAALQSELGIAQSEVSRLQPFEEEARVLRAKLSDVAVVAPTLVKIRDLANEALDGKPIQDLL